MDPGFEGKIQACEQCGKFKITGTAIAVIADLTPTKRLKLSCWAREQFALGELPEINSDIAKRVANFPIPGIIERADRLLRYAIENETFLGETFGLNRPILRAVTYSQDLKDIRYLASFLDDQGYLVYRGGPDTARATAKGRIRYEQMQTERKDSAQGFVAMWFNKETEGAYSGGFAPGIEGAGYRSFRVDKHEHANKIDDEIIAQIRNSRFLVADFTGHRGGVYFEAGFALGLNIPVIWTCRKDHLEDLHFDTRQFNCIDWTEPAELAVRLQRRIEAVVGVGPHKQLPQ